MTGQSLPETSGSRWTIYALGGRCEAYPDEPNEGDTEGIAVMPVAEHEALLAEERKIANSMSVDVTRFGEALMVARDAMVHRPVDSDLFRDAIATVTAIVGNGDEARDV